MLCENEIIISIGVNKSASSISTASSGFLFCVIVEQ